MQGRTVGSEQVSVSATPDGLTIKSSGGSKAAVTSCDSAEFVYGPSGAPLRLRTEARIKDQALIVDTSVADGKATSKVTQGETASEVTHEIANDAIFLPNNVFAAVQGLAYRVVTLPAGATIPLYVAPQAQVMATLSAVSDERMQTAAGMYEVRRHVLDIDNAGTPMVLMLWAEKATGRLIRYSIAAAGVDVVRKTSPASSRARSRSSGERPDAAHPGLRLQSRGDDLASGRQGRSRQEGQERRAPAAIVLVGGSGNVDRDTIAYGVPVMGQLAGQLAEAGWLVVRYDKRGVGQSGGRAESATLSDYADDVVSVVKWLRKQKDVDGKRVFVVGHSEGGAVALIAATRSSDIKAVVTIAAPGTKGAELVLEQQRRALEGLKIADEEKQRRIDLQKQVMNAVLTGQGWEGVPEPAQAGRHAVVQEFPALDPAPVMKKVEQPLLIMHGELDKQVPIQNAELLNGLATQRKKGVATLTLVPAINHLLVPAKTGEVAEYGSLADAQVSPEVSRLMVDWLKQLPVR